MFSGKEDLKITGEIVEEGFTDYTENYPIEGVEKLQGQELNFQTDLDTGILTISGTGENSLVKMQVGSKTAEFDLSGENSFLKIDPATGQIKEYDYKVSESFLHYENFELSESQKLQGIPEGSKISYTEKDGLKIEFSEYAGEFSKETLELKNVKEFDFSFAGAGKDFARIETFNFKTEQGGSQMKFLNGEFFLTEGKVSMERGVWNFPDNSRVQKLPETEKLMNIKIENYDLKSEMMIKGKNLIISKGVVKGLNKDFSFDGGLGFNKGNLFVPATEKYRTELLGISISSKGEIGEKTDQYLYFDKTSASASGKNNYVLMTEDVFKLKEGVGGNLDMHFSKENPYLEGFFSENDYLGITSGALGEGGSLELKKGGLKDSVPLIKIDGSLQVYNDGKKMNILPETQSRSKQITLFNVESTYAGKGSVPLQIITEMNQKTSAGNDIAIETLFLEDRDKIFFRSNYGSTEDFVAVDYSLREIVQPEELILPEMPFGTRISYEQIKFFESRDFANEFAIVKDHNKKMKTLQNNAKLEFENLVKNEFGINRGEEILEKLRKTDDPEEYISELEKKGIVKSGKFPSLDQKTTQKFYPEIVKDRENAAQILKEWKEKGYSTEELDNLLGPLETEIPRFGYRMYSDNFDVPVSEWYKIFY